MSERATFSDGNRLRLDFVRGDRTGLSMPAHPDALHAGGATFLTRAFHSFGTLLPDNRVSRITRIAPCPGGATGAKVFVSVEYEKPGPALHADLFVKFSRDFDDVLRDRGKHEMESEIRLAELSRHPSFPIEVPKAYFADYHLASQTGLLITQVIGFGEDPIEPQHEKCMDHLIDDPLPYYRTILRALACIAAADRSGQLGDDVERLFPLNRDEAAGEDTIPWSPDELRGRIRRYAEFAHSLPQLMPVALRSPVFWSKLEREATRFLAHQELVKQVLQADPDAIALCHWNANIDNAWFWTDTEGMLRCGLMDWGRARRLNLAFALWGCLNAAPHRLWHDHLDELLDFFVAELCRMGGPVLEVGRLKLAMDLYVATMGLAWLVEAPMRILRYLPNAAEMSGPLDPRLLACERARNQLHVSTLFLSLWDRHDFGRSLDIAIGGWPLPLTEDESDER